MDHSESDDNDDLFLPTPLSVQQQSRIPKTADKMLSSSSSSHGLRGLSSDLEDDCFHETSLEDSRSFHEKDVPLSHFHDTSALEDSRSFHGAPLGASDERIFRDGDLTPVHHENRRPSSNHDPAAKKRYEWAVHSKSSLSTSGSISPPTRELRQGSIVDGLLHEIYDHWHSGRHDSFDSDTLTECSSTSEFMWCSRHDISSFGLDGGAYHSASERRQGGALTKPYLQNQDTVQLRRILTNVQRLTAVMSARLVKQLKRRDRRLAKRNKNYDVVTAIIQAASLKRQIDTRMRFSIQPPPGQPSAFDQWRDAMRAVCRLPMGMPTEFRKKVWLSLADHYLVQLRINWEKTLRFVFNERSNPDDDKLGMQIVKDLHRTGCSNFSGDDNVEARAILKRVLLAYARWNKRVGYCQGFNVIAALLLNVMDRKEDDALKVMIFLIDSVLPESYFANNLRALSVDMAVFRDLLSLTYPRLSKHLDRLQLQAQDARTGACYEPPLTNVFTMQWFLTLFATCLPVSFVLRVWDSVLLEGSEILLRTALTIWGKLSKSILRVSSADEFYSVMGELSSGIMQGTVMDGDTFIKSIYALGDFPLPHLNELREKYTYNIRPLTPATSNGTKKVSGGRSLIKAMLYSDDDEMDDDDIAAMACMPGEMGSSSSTSSDISVLGPGVYGPGFDSSGGRGGGAMQMERMSTDIHSLKLQYQRLKQRQQQAHIIIAAASQKKAHLVSSSKKAPHSHTSATASSSSTSSSTPSAQHRQGTPSAISPPILLPSIESPTAMNHLFVGKTNRLSASAKNRLVTEGPRIAQQAPSAHTSAILSKQLQAVANAQAVSKSQRMKAARIKKDGYSSSGGSKNVPSNVNVTTTSTVSVSQTPPASITQSASVHETSASAAHADPMPTNDSRQHDGIASKETKQETLSTNKPGIASKTIADAHQVKDKSPNGQSTIEVVVTTTNSGGQTDGNDDDISDKCVQTSFELSDRSEDSLILVEDRGVEESGCWDNGENQTRKEDGQTNMLCSAMGDLPQNPNTLCGTQSFRPSLASSLVSDDKSVVGEEETHSTRNDNDTTVPYSEITLESRSDLNSSKFSSNIQDVSNQDLSDFATPHSSLHSKDTESLHLEKNATVSSLEIDILPNNSTNIPEDSTAIPDDSGIESSSTISPFTTPRKEVEPLDDLQAAGLHNDLVSCTISSEMDEVLAVTTLLSSGNTSQSSTSVSQVIDTNSPSSSILDNSGVSNIPYSHSNSIIGEESSCIPGKIPATPDIDSRENVITSDRNDTHEIEKETELPSSDNSREITLQNEDCSYYEEKSNPKNMENYEDNDISSSRQLQNVLSIATPSSPQRKFLHRSLSHHEDSSYVSSPGLIETIPVPENFAISTSSDEDLQIESCITNNSNSFSSSKQPAVKANGSPFTSAQAGQRRHSERKSTKLEQSHHASSQMEAVRQKMSSLRTKSDPSECHRRLSVPSSSLIHSNPYQETVGKNSMPARPFNPFPIKLFNANRAKTGLKLGLYTTSTLEQLKGMKARTTST